MPDRDGRIKQLKYWLETELGGEVPLEVVSADASARRYFRLRHGGESLIAMDAPPPEDCAAFVRIAHLLRDAGVHAPRIYAQDLEAGFLLLEDMGSHTYLDSFTRDNAWPLMADAIDALLCWQGASESGRLPVYDHALLSGELRLFPDWYLAHASDDGATPRQQAVLDQAFERLVAAALAQPRVYVHRDYMPRNLMPGTPNPGVLDFQDAVYGPVTYDIVSLFQDAFVSWPADFVEKGMRRYWEGARHAGVPVHDEYADFRRDADWMGMQRHLKVIGVFSRLAQRDGKPRYREDIPRFFSYLHASTARYPELGSLHRVLAEVVPEVRA